LYISKQPNTATIVVYGKANEKASMNFNISSPATKEVSTRMNIEFGPDDKPRIYTINTGIQEIRVLAVNETIADRTWFMEKDHKNFIVFGPAYVRDIQNDNHSISIQSERPWMDTGHHSVWLYTDGKELQLFAGSVQSSPNINSLKLSAWQKIDATDKAGLDYDDKNWRLSDDPMQMGADGDLTADAWYRTAIDIKESGQYTMQVQGGGRAIGFVDGKMSLSANIKDGEMVFDLKSGKHRLAIFSAHDGRDKLAGYIGYIDEVDAKGLYGKTLLVKGVPMNHDIDGWKYLKAKNKDEVQAGPPVANADGWKDYTIGQDVFDLKQGFAWFNATLDDPPSGVTRMELDFKSVDENATVFINGKQVAHHDGWNSPFKVFIDRADTLQRPLRLSVFIENYSNEGGIDKPVRINFIKPGSTPITGWRLKGGVGELESLKNWKFVNDTLANDGPGFYRSTFMYVKNKNSTPIYRVSTKGLGHGSIWVNGHNLGRYPEKIDINSLYIPECWMKEGENVLTIFDEDGKNPQAVSIDAEIPASRSLQTFSSQTLSSPLN
jgi:beta-galactosidase